MPELPEVETIRKDLQKELAGLEIVDIISDTPKMIKSSLKAVKEAIIGQKVKKFRRRAKLVIVELSDRESFLLIHLKLTGRLLVRGQKDSKDEWTRIVLKFSGGKELRFADLRKFGFIKLVNRRELTEVLQQYGPEPLDDLTLSDFKKIIKGSKKAIKILLMDQSLISGVGNIYANDALFLARIHPETPARQLSDREIKNLFESLEEVLKEGLKYRGASDQHYLDAYGKKGDYQSHFKVYGRKKELCIRCGTEIKKIKVAQRGTYFCPKCQKIYNRQTG